MSPFDILIITALLTLLVLGLGLLLAGAGVTLQAIMGERGQPGSLGRAWTAVEQQWRIEHFIYRHHRISGAVIMLASAFFFWQFATLGIFSGSPLDSAWELPIWLLVAGNAANLVVGLIVFFRPSRLKPIEAVTNHWFAVDSRSVANRLAMHPRLRGLLILLAAVVVLAGTGVLLTERLAAAM